MRKTLLVMGLCVASVVRAQQPTNPKIDSLFPEHPTNYVTDAAGALKGSAVSALNQKLAQIDSVSKVQIGVVLLPTIKDYQPYEVAMDIGRKWGVGHKGAIGDPERNRGIVLLVVPKGPRSARGQCFIAPAGGVQGFITDATAGNICREMVDFFRAGDYEGGVWKGVNRLNARIVAALAPPSPPKPTEPMDWTPVLVVVGVLVLVLIAAVIAVKRTAAKRRNEDEAERAREARERAEWLHQDALRRMQEMERRQQEEAKEAARWGALTPEQQRVELEAKERERLRLEDIRRQQEAVAATRRAEQKKRDRKKPSVDTSTSTSDSGGSSSGGSSSGFDFGGGGSFDGGGGGSSW